MYNRILMAPTRWFLGQNYGHPLIFSDFVQPIIFWQQPRLEAASCSQLPKLILYLQLDQASGLLCIYIYIYNLLFQLAIVSPSDFQFHKSQSVTLKKSDVWLVVAFAYQFLLSSQTNELFSMIFMNRMCTLLNGSKMDQYEVSISTGFTICWCKLLVPTHLNSIEMVGVILY